MNFERLGVSHRADVERVERERDACRAEAEALRARLRELEESKRQHELLMEARLEEERQVRIKALVESAARRIQNAALIRGCAAGALCIGASGACSEPLRHTALDDLIAANEVELEDYTVGTYTHGPAELKPVTDLDRVSRA